MVETNQVPFLYRKWVEENEGSMSLSARAFILLWWLDRVSDGKQDLPMWFPLSIGNLQPVDSDDPAFVEGCESEYIVVVQNDSGARYVELTDKGKTILVANVVKVDQLDVLFEI